MGDTALAWEAGQTLVAAGQRRVRTTGGSEMYDQAIGTVIRTDLPKAKLDFPNQGMRMPPKPMSLEELSAERKRDTPENRRRKREEDAKNPKLIHLSDDPNQLTPATSNPPPRRGQLPTPEEIEALLAKVTRTRRAPTTIPGDRDETDPNFDVPFNERLGRCYEFAGQYAMNGNTGNVTLIHGSIQGAGHPRLDHAWVERENGSIFEPASGNVMSKAAFKQFFSPHVDYAYSRYDMLDHMTHSGHFGPWQNKPAKPPNRGPKKPPPGPTGDFEEDSPRVMVNLAQLIEEKQDTENLYDHVDGKPGKWQRAREILHEEVIAAFLNGEVGSDDRTPGKVKAEGKMLVMGGLPGAGKTTFLNSPEGQARVGVDMDEYVIINPDEVKSIMIERGMLPDWPNMTADEAATLFHEESTMLSKEIMRRAIEDGKNFVFDTSIKNRSQLTKALAQAEAAGQKYETTLVFVDVGIETASARAVGRYENGGRFIPLEFIEQQASADPMFKSINAAEFEALKPSVGRWVHVDNENLDGSGPKIVGDSIDQSESRTQELLDELHARNQAR